MLFTVTLGAFSLENTPSHSLHYTSDDVNLPRRTLNGQGGMDGSGGRRILQADEYDNTAKPEETTGSATGLGNFAVGDSVLVFDEAACIASIVNADQGIVTINYADGITFGERIGVNDLTLVQAGVGCTTGTNTDDDVEEDDEDMEGEEEFELAPGAGPNHEGYLSYPDESVFESDFEANPTLPAFPAYNQHCEDDAGPRWMYDNLRYGEDKFYW